MKLFEYIDKSQFDEMVALGYIKVVDHPSGCGHKLINYTKLCNSEKIWNPTTERCRGIVIDKDYDIIARPFKKFYNYEEYEDTSVIPIDEYFEVFEKLDGSLGILYWIDDVPYICTKGSFESEQALHATNLLHTKYRHVWDKLDKRVTFLFEIIYPEDLHCVSYNGIDDIILIGALSTNYENLEHPLHIFNNIFPIVKTYDGVKDWKLLRDVFSGDNREGFVVKFSSNFRLKLKYESYWRLHYLKAGFTEKAIYDYLKNSDDSYLEAMKLFDEEHQIYYQKTIDKFLNAYNRIYEICKNEYKDDFETDKDAALYIQTCTYPHVLFAMRKNQTNVMNNLIWKYVKQETKFEEND